MSTPKPITPQSPSAQDISTLPQPYKSLWITNKRLQKQIDILNIQLSQKDHIIKQLKLQIDSTILQDTKNRLQVIRCIQDQVNIKIKQAKQEYLDKINNIEQQLEKKISIIFNLEKQLQIQKEQNRKIAHKMKQFKQHVIIALEQKDLIIMELTKIVNFQQMENKVQKIKKQALQRYGINQDISNRDQKLWKTIRIDNQNPLSKNKASKFQGSKVQIKRNI